MRFLLEETRHKIRDKMRWVYGKEITDRFKPCPGKINDRERIFRLVIRGILENEIYVANNHTNP